MKYIVAFFAFWWDFIVGDSITLAVGTVIGILGGYVFVQGGAATAAEVMLPAVVLVTLVISLRVR